MFRLTVPEALRANAKAKYHDEEHPFSWEFEGKMSPPVATYSAHSGRVTHPFCAEANSDDIVRSPL
jgi:hypothetical protein